MNSLKAILDSVLKNKVPGFSEKETEFEIIKIWHEAVGDKIAKNSWPVKMIDQKTLLIASDNSVWLNQLRYLEAEILNKLEERLKKRLIEKLKFKIETRR